MATKNIDQENLLVTGAHVAIGDDAHVSIQTLAGAAESADSVIVVVTQVFGAEGDDIMEASTVKFDDMPGVPVLVQADGREEIVHLSPFHGDPRKVGMEGLAPGTKCTLLCPVSRTRLERVGTVGGDSDADLYALYLTTRMSDGECIMLSDVWDDFHSRIIDNFELISSWEVDASS